VPHQRFCHDNGPRTFVRGPFPKVAGTGFEPANSGLSTVTETTFGKWGAQMERALGDGGDIGLTGVATNCCVLSRALAAADAGVRVQADGCAGSTDANHQRALDTRAGWAPPLIEITDSESVLANFK
jgi:nicotinamidase-related amidase